MKTHTKYEVRAVDDDAIVYAAFPQPLQALRYWHARGEKDALVRVVRVYDEEGGKFRHEERLIN